MIYLERTMRWLWAAYLTLTASPVLAQAVAPAATATQASSDSQHILTSPSWIRAPNGDDLHAAWPVKALERGEGGRALVTCVVNIDGTTSACKIKSETPPGEGFGAAALMLTPNFLFHPATRDGQPVQGTVTVPINFANRTQGHYVPVDTVRVLPWANWEKAPTTADLQAVYPANALASGKEGHVVLRCGFDRKGGLEDCETITVQPGWSGFEPAARRLTKLFQMKVTDASRKNLDTYRINLAVHFRPLPVNGSNYINEPNWTRSIKEDHPSAIFPAEASKAGIRRGVGVVDCTIETGGVLTQCKVVSETPPGLGFGDAAVSTASMLSVNLWTQAGQPTVGAHLKAPFAFVESPDGDKPAATTAKP